MGLSSGTRGWKEVARLAALLLSLLFSEFCSACLELATCLDLSACLELSTCLDHSACLELFAWLELSSRYSRTHSATQNTQRESPSYFEGKEGDLLTYNNH